MKLLKFKTVTHLITGGLRYFGMRIVTFSLCPGRRTTGRVNIQVAARRRIVAGDSVMDVRVPTAPRARRLFGGRAVTSVGSNTCLVGPTENTLISLSTITRTLADNGLTNTTVSTFRMRPLPLSSPVLGYRGVILAPRAKTRAGRSCCGMDVAATESVVGIVGKRRPRRYMGGWGECGRIIREGGDTSRKYQRQGQWDSYLRGSEEKD